MATFRWVFVEVYVCHCFNFVNMRFAVDVIFFCDIYFHVKFATEFCSFSSSFYSHMLTWMIKYHFTENNFLPYLKLMNHDISNVG